MRLLSRNAEALFWLARYLERGASLARVIEMQSSFGGQDQENGWNWLLTLYADEARFKEKHEVSSPSIIGFYVSEMANGGSIRSSIHWARENARALRPFIPLEMWVQLNAFHTAVEAYTAEDISPAELPRTCAEIRAGCLAQIGIAESTLFRDEGYLFFKLGMMIERADQTSRLLDVKFAQVTANGPSVDPANEFVFWTTILRTAAAYQVFHRLETGSANPDRVARFLILNPSHPRSIGFCVREISEALHQLRGGFHLSRASSALEACEVLMEGMQTAGTDPKLSSRLHVFNDWVQGSLMTLTSAIQQAFFVATAPPEPREPRTQEQTQSPQSQTQSTSSESATQSTSPPTQTRNDTKSPSKPRGASKKQDPSQS